MQGTINFAMPRRESSSDIDEAAAKWALRIDEAALGAGEQREFERWLEGDVRRVGAFARAQAVLVHVKRAKALGPAFEPETGESEPGDGDSRESVDGEPEPAVFTRRRLIAGASAMAAAGAIAFVIPTRQAAAHVYRTRRGETRSFTLEDGSTVSMNTDSEIAVRIGESERRATLVRGEALFTVAGGAKDPFVVETDDVSVRARNATFALCRLDDRPFELKVCEGSVELQRGPFIWRRTRLLGANTEAILAADGSILERNVTPERLERGLAWQEGMLSFEDTPLSEAAREFARYSDRRILIRDPAVRSETITGRYAATNPEGFARAAALSLDLHMQTGPSGIMLSR